MGYEIHDGKNRALKIALIVIALGSFCYCGLLAVVSFPGYMEPDTRSIVARVRADMRSIATALEAYGTDASFDPVALTELNMKTTEEEAFEAMMSGGMVYPPSEILPDDPKASVFATGALTTPIAYLTTIPLDPFAPSEGETFRYQSLEDWWLLWSPGPDKTYDITPLSQPFVYGETLPVGLLNSTYDPTNGTVSSGDIWRVRQ